MSDPIRPLTPFASDPLTEAQIADDEAIARLLQMEYDEEVRLSIVASGSSTPVTPITPTTPLTPSSGVSEIFTPTATIQKLQNHAKSISQHFSMAEAKHAVKSTLNDLISFVKTEASRAGQTIATPASPLYGPASGPTMSDPRAHAFSEFLDKMNDRRAYPLVKYYRSFIRDFNKRTWSVNEQVRVIRDFLNFMKIQLPKNELFIQKTPEELHQAEEGFEKLVMHRLFQSTFSPKTTDDAVQDELLSHKITLFEWVTLKHLDVDLNLDIATPFIEAAKRELQLMDQFKAPADKLDCVLNCCKHIFALMEAADAPSQGADSLLPLLIYAVLRSNPPQLVSNLHYIQRFRDPTVLQGEPGYYLTHMLGTVRFLHTMDHTSLAIDKETFDQHLDSHMGTLDEDAAVFEMESLSLRDPQDENTGEDVQPSAHDTKENDAP